VTDHPLGFEGQGPGAHVELEHGDGIVCFVPLNEVADSDAADSDLILGRHGLDLHPWEIITLNNRHASAKPVYADLMY
jgi:hypothetical protein